MKLLSKRNIISFLVIFIIYIILFIFGIVSCVSNKPINVRLSQYIKKDSLLNSFGVTNSYINGKQIININEHTKCSLLANSRFFETDSCFYSIFMITKDGQTIFKTDSILSLGEIKYDKTTQTMVIPLILYQNMDDFSTDGKLLYCDLKTNQSFYVSNQMRNSTAADLQEGGAKCIYISTDTLYSYDLRQHKETPLMFFDIPMMYAVNINQTKEKFSLLFYYNFFEDFMDFNPAKIAEFYNTKP